MAFWRRRLRPAETAPSEAWGWWGFLTLWLGLWPAFIVAAGFVGHGLTRLFDLGWGLWRW